MLQNVCAILVSKFGVAVADPGFSKGRGDNHRSGDAIYYFGQFSQKNCLKTKKLDTEVELAFLALPLDPPNVYQRGKIIFPERCYLVVVSRSLTTTNMAVT